MNENKNSEKEIIEQESSENVPETEDVSEEEEISEETISEDKREEIEETLEDIDKLVKEKVEEKQESIEESVDVTEGPITLFLKSPDVEKQINKLKELSETGVSKTQKNVIIFYKHATSWGDRLRGLVFFLLGASIFSTSVLASYRNFFDLSELIFIIFRWAGGLPARVLVAGIGICLIAYGIDRMTKGLKEKIFPKKPEKKPYIQKRLVDKEEK